MAHGTTGRHGENVAPPVVHLFTSASGTVHFLLQTMAPVKDASMKVVFVRRSVQVNVNCATSCNKEIKGAAHKHQYHYKTCFPVIANS